MYKHGSGDSLDLNINVSDDESIESRDESISEGQENILDDRINDTFVNPSIFENFEDSVAKSVEFNIFVKCRDKCLRNDREFYMEKLNSMCEVNSVENLWIQSKPGYQVGDYLSANLKIMMTSSEKWINDEKFRKNIWDSLEIKETRENLF